MNDELDNDFFPVDCFVPIITIIKNRLIYLINFYLFSFVIFYASIRRPNA